MIGKVMLKGKVGNVWEGWNGKELGGRLEWEVEAELLDVSCGAWWCGCGTSSHFVHRSPNLGDRSGVVYRYCVPLCLCLDYMLVSALLVWLCPRVPERSGPCSYVVGKVLCVSIRGVLVLMCSDPYTVAFCVTLCLDVAVSR